MLVHRRTRPYSARRSAPRRSSAIASASEALEEIAVVGQAYDIFDPLDEWYVAGLLADA